MDLHILLFALYAACLFGKLALLLLVVRKHTASNRTTKTNFPPTPTWRFRSQEASSLLAWVSALAFGVLTLCFHLGAIESEVTASDAASTREDRLRAEQDFTPNPVLFLATLFGHMTILWDMMLAFDVRQPPRNWAIAGAVILMLDSTSIVVTAVAAVEVGAKEKTTVMSQILPPMLTTLADGSMALFTAMTLRGTKGLSSNTRPYLSISAMLRHLHVVPLWIWPFLSGGAGAIACQYLGMLILVCPWRYSPVAFLWRWRRRSVVANSQSIKQPGSQTDGSESTRELVPHISQDLVPMVPASMMPAMPASVASEIGRVKVDDFDSQV